MNKINVTMLLAVSTLSLVGSAVASQNYNLKADVPFDFQVNKTAFAAGKYMVKDGRVTVPALRNAKTGASAFVVGAYATLGSYTPSSTREGKLVFHCYAGHKCFLAQIWSPEGLGSAVPKSAAEKAMENNENAQEMAIIEIKLYRAG